MTSEAVIMIRVDDNGMVSVTVEGEGTALDIAEQLFSDDEDGGNV